MNSVMVIHPYKYHGTWVFDDDSVGLRREAFVSGADHIIDRLTTHIPDAAAGFTLLFSAAPFPGYQARLDWRQAEFEGNWYHSADLDMEGWLCPSLLLYFESPPPTIYAQFKPAKTDADSTRS